MGSEEVETTRAIRGHIYKHGNGKRGAGRGETWRNRPITGRPIFSLFLHRCVYMCVCVWLHGVRVFQCLQIVMIVFDWIKYAKFNSLSLVCPVLYPFLFISSLLMDTMSTIWLGSPRMTLYESGWSLCVAKWCRFQVIGVGFHFKVGLGLLVFSRIPTLDLSHSLSLLSCGLTHDVCVELVDVEASHATGSDVFPCEQTQAELSRCLLH